MRSSTTRCDGQRSAQRLRGSAVACLLATFVTTTARAQSPRVGHIVEVRGVVSSGGCDRRYALQGTRGSVSLIRRNVETFAWPADSAVLLDILHVRRHTDVRFRVESARFGVGNFFLTSELGRCPQAKTDLMANGFESDSGEGTFKLASRLERSGGRQIERLELTVVNGTAIVEWSKGPLTVVALHQEIRDSGTVFTVVVDSARNRALLHVREGVVTMAGVAIRPGAAGDGFVFGREGPRQLVSMNTAFDNDELYHSRTIWTQAYKPGFPIKKVLVGMALVGVGVWYWIDTRKGKTSGPYAGTLNVKIPL